MEGKSTLPQDPIPPCVVRNLFLEHWSIKLSIMISWVPGHLGPWHRVILYEEIVAFEPTTLQLWVRRSTTTATQARFQDHVNCIKNYLYYPNLHKLRPLRPLRLVVDDEGPAWVALAGAGTTKLITWSSYVLVHGTVLLFLLSFAPSFDFGIYCMLFTEN